MITPDNPYFSQVQLLVRALPIVAEEKCFALKGGTAINLFVRDLPRLSVDIDLAYMPINGRATALAEIDTALRNIQSRLAAAPLNCHVQQTANEAGQIIRLFAAQQRAQIKIEVTPVLRGAVYAPEQRVVVPAAEAAFGFAEVQSLSFEDLYAGKLVAALDRQHPRDLFDAKLLLDGEGISPKLFQAFLVYLISHDRPIAEVLFPGSKPLARIYQEQFIGMTNEQVSLEALELAREQLITRLHGMIDGNTKEFLLSFKRKEPRWQLLAVPHAQDLPAVKWKLQNLAKMQADAHAAATAKLEAALSSV